MLAQEEPICVKISSFIIQMIHKYKKFHGAIHWQADLSTNKLGEMIHGN